MWSVCVQVEREQDSQTPAEPQDPDILSQDLLRKYITYAKANCKPKLQHADYEKITQVRPPRASHCDFTCSYYMLRSCIAFLRSLPELP